MKISALPVFVTLFLLGASQINWKPNPGSEKTPCKPIISHEALGIRFQVRGRYQKGITQKQLREAKSLSDIIEHYPANWIDEYDRVVIESTQDHQPVLAQGKNENLTKDQLNILQQADLESYVCIDVHYNSANSATNELEPNTMHKVLRIIPEREAEYKEGQEALIQYIKDGCNTLNFKTVDNSYPFPTIYFSVDELGVVHGVELIESTGDSIIDMRLMQLLREMPDWNPALNERGEAVSQAFQLHVGLPGC